MGFGIGILWAAFLTTAVVLRAGSVSGPLHLAPPHADPALTPPGLVVQPPDQSYDGEFFYRMSVAPFSTEQWENGVRFDDAALRWSRIVYPSIAFALSFGNESLAPLALLVTNVIAAGFVAAAGVSLAKRFGRPWFHGLVLLMLPGVTYALTGALSDAVAIALVATALSCVIVKRPVAASALLAGAALTRESTLMVAVGLVVAGALPVRFLPVWAEDSVRDRARVAAPGLVALVAAGCWQLVIRAVWGNVGAANSGGHNFTFPFGTYLSDPSVLVPSDGFAALRVFVVLLSLVTVILVLLTKPWTSRTTAFLIPAIFIAAIAASSLGPVIVANFRNLGRATTEVVLLSTVAALGMKRAAAANWAIVALAVGGGVIALWDIWATTPL
ncbi:MAG: hypothetical protein KAZ88_03265 [Acidimicrobiia bacterium]|nr:hypothetical protein [Acidimicrobiia bacterium]